MTAVLESKKEEVVTLCQRYHVDRLELFGSAATERYDPLHSDLDFLVQFRAATPEEHADRYFGLLADLQDLFGCPIDLVEIPAIVNPYFLEGIEASRALVYAD
jgi:uncharacterized protein